MMRRISFAAAVARAGSLEAVLACLRAGDVMAYHGGLYNEDGRLFRRKDDHIPVEWWKTARDIDPAASRVWFRRHIIYDMTLPSSPSKSSSRPARRMLYGRQSPSNRSRRPRKRRWDNSTGREAVGKAAAKPSSKQSHPWHPAWRRFSNSGVHHRNHGPWLNAHAAATDVLNGEAKGPDLFTTRFTKEFRIFVRNGWA